jgi:hypothetical protein
MKYNELRGSERFEKLYSDKELEVVVVKSFDSCKEQGKNTGWCSNIKDGFYRHNLSANMYRFNWKDGYKLRLTWDYIQQSAANDKFGGGTHWGSGGLVDGEYVDYMYIRVEDNDEPFYFDYHKNDERQEMVDRIETIPQKVIDIVHKYQDVHSTEKTNNIKNLYNDINSIVVTSVELIKSDDYVDSYKVLIKYKGKEYKIKYAEYDKHKTISYSKRFRKVFNNYAFDDDYKTLKNYLIDKIKEFQK